MTVNRKVTGTAVSVPVGLTGGMLIALGITIFGSAICGYLIFKEALGENTVGYCSMAILTISSFAGAAFSAGRIKRRRLLMCGLSGVIYYALLLATTALFFGGQYQGMGVTALMVSCGCGLAVLMGMGQGRRPRRRSKQYVHR